MVSLKSFLSSLVLLTVLIVIGGVKTVHAQAMPTKAQIEQFKNLPRSQQEALARQYGVDPSMLNGSSSSSSGTSSAAKVQPVTTPRTKDNSRKVTEQQQKEREKSKESPKPFGYDLFSGEPETFAPTSYAPVPANYIMGVGDTLKIQLFGKESRSYELTIDREGKVFLPSVGELTLTGLSYSLMKELIQSQVKERLIGVNVAVSMGNLRSIQVFIAGEAYKPGAYTVSSLSTISQALYVAGGVSDIASLRSIRLMRDGKVITEFDLYDLLLEGDASGDKLLQSGDVVFIPPRGDMITVKGEVKRPALYELKGNETLQDALMFSGGAAEDAYLSVAQLKRTMNGKRLIQSIDLTSETQLKKKMKGGDVLTLRPISDSLDNSLLLVGAVSRPGYYEWESGLRINDILKDSRFSLLEHADLEYGLVVRETGQRREIKLYQFNVAEAIRGNNDENLQLNEKDQIVIFSRYQTKQEEAQQLSRFALSARERAIEQRKLDKTNVKTPSTGELDDATALFGTPDKDDSNVSKANLAAFSRDKLLEPIMLQLRQQSSSAVSAPVVYIAGEVNYPGVYPLVENASVSRLLQAAGGVKDSAYLKRAEITRFEYENGSGDTEYLTVSLKDVLSGHSDLAIQGRDRLNVLSIPEWQNTYEVTLRGEVRFPGTYAIKRGDTLTELVKRAGGFTEHAFIDGAVFTRREIRQRERQRKQSLAEELRKEIAGNMLTGTGDSRVSYSEMRTLLSDLLAVEPVGRLIMDLPKLLSSNGNNDIQLKDGDTLHIPSLSDSISIMGEVQMTTSYRFDSEMTVSDYIERSGGTREKADEERIYIVKANGSIELYDGGSSWFSFNNESKLGPGDTIIVPMNTTYTDDLALWSQVTTILYNSAVAIAAINSI